MTFSEKKKRRKLLIKSRRSSRYGRERGRKDGSAREGRLGRTKAEVAGKRKTHENVRRTLGEKNDNHPSATHSKVRGSFFNPTTTSTIPPVVFLVKLYSPNKTLAQSRFTGNLIKAARLRRTPLCTAKSNLPSIRFARRSIHLHCRLLGTICGHLELRERSAGGGERWGRAPGKKKKSK